MQTDGEKGRQRPRQSPLVRVSVHACAQIFSATDGELLNRLEGHEEAAQVCASARERACAVSAFARARAHGLPEAVRVRYLHMCTVCVCAYSVCLCI